MPKSIAGSNVLSYDETQGGLVVTGTTTGGTPPTTANVFATGCAITDTNSGVTYRNFGTSAAPSWGTDVMVKQVDLTAAQIIAMYAAPIEVVPSVAGKAIVVDAVEFVITRTATAFVNGGVVNVQYAATANGAGTKTHADIAATVVTGAAGTSYTARIPLVQSDIATASITGIGLYVSNASAAFATGTGTASLTVRYHLV